MPLEGSAANWHRFFLGLPINYMSPDPAMRWASVGLTGDPYTYAAGNPVVFIDPTGLTVTCTFSQSTGHMTCVDDSTGQQVVNSNGYAGQGAGLNNPNAQSQQNVGPLPQGNYTIGPGTNSPNTGPLTLPLTPAPGNNMYGRSAFRIHGDNAAQNNTASHGCAIMPHNVRQIINNSGGGTLHVTQ
jgi:hypothetical protein